MRGLGAVLVALSLMLQPAMARHQGPIKLEDVVRVLKHRADPVPADFASVGGGVDSVLAELVCDPKADEELRRRAARALGRMGGQRAVQVLVVVMSSRDVPQGVRASAMVGLALARGEAALDDVKPYLRDESPALRVGAAEALGAMGGERARALLTDTMEHEDVLEVRAAMEAALRSGAR